MSRLFPRSLGAAFLLAMGVGAAFLSLNGPSAFAKYRAVATMNVPVQRVAQNLEKTIEMNPKDAGAILNLARVHAMAYSQKKEEIPVEKNDETRVWFGYEAKLVPFASVQTTDDADRKKAAQAHLNAAIALYEKAVKLEPEDKRAQLGYGWLVSQTDNKAQAIKILREVIRTSWEEEKNLERLGLGGHTFTVEGAAYLKPLLDPTKDKEELAQLSERAELLKKLPRPITPIAIPLEDGLGAGDLEDRNARVRFDADGTGVKKNWSWIRPNAAWLVYRPAKNQKIESGLDLFGSVTFWLFWDNGYEALAALDDNRDGRLSGRELTGLGLWNDVNGDGICQESECKTLAQAGIQALSCRYERDSSHPDQIAFSPRGVTLKDGRTRPTFDLILHSAN